MSKIIVTLYAVMDKRPLRALSFVMALLLAGRLYVLGPVTFCREDQ